MDSTTNFNYWWLNVVPLTAGSHVLEVEGYNSGSIGAFGAELAGPFAAESLGTDAAVEAADYEGSLLWSTADAIGSAFPIGDSVGWTCPDGTTFDRCADDPVCVGEETAACE